jgi:hypothetical protein
VLESNDLKVLLGFVELGMVSSGILGYVSLTLRLG